MATYPTKFSAPDNHDSGSFSSLRRRRAICFAYGALLSLITLLICPPARADQSLRALKITTAKIRVLHFDGFEKGYKRVEQISRGSGRRGITLLRRGAKKRQLLNGDRISGRGRKLRAHAVLVYEQSLQVAQAAAQQLGPHSIALVRITSADSAVRCSTSLLTERMWTGARNVKGLYEAASYGAFTFLSDSNNNGQPDVYDVTIPSTTLGRCNNYYTIANEAEHELSLRGISLSNFSQVIYYLPDNAHYTTYNNITGVGTGQICSWAGMAGGGTAYIAGELCGQHEQHMDVLAHEIGHNLNLGHAGKDLNGDGDLFDVVNNTSEQYNDVSCLMAYGGNHYRHFNAPHKDRLGWLQRKTTVTLPGVYTLSAVELPNPPANTSHMITIPNGTRDLYVSYRDTIDQYSAPWIGNLMSKVSVHQFYSQGPSMSFLLSSLSDGQTFNDASNVQISMLSHSFGQAQVKITFGCSALAPTISFPSPQIKVGNAPKLVQIDLTNGDPSGCTASDFQVTLTGPTGISISPQTFPVSLTPGQTQVNSITISAAPSMLDGDYTLQATMTALGHPSGSASVPLRVDRTPPAAPMGFSLN